MASKVWMWKGITGVSGRCNDVLYTRPKSQLTQDLLVFFGGDVQDTQENMEKHSDSKEYIKWSLENTATILSEQFPRHHVFVVRPARMSVTKCAVFSCFDNFVPGDKYGTPTFRPMHQALKHLRQLLLCCLEHVKTLGAKEDVDNQRNIEAESVSLIGFSKGCAVLNQFLHEFHYYDENPSDDTDVRDFVRLIRDMWWLDGGHNGSKDTWITEREVLESFAKLSKIIQQLDSLFRWNMISSSFLGINAHIHVTPYQIRDNFRPWIRAEENSFNETLRRIGVSVQRVLHFGDSPKSLSSHFGVLADIG
ncbi:hypothetical protein DMN91_000734 [Ooceraea biroi]|uniref:Uncharacterized protein n=1 Tax=Ooceraea biroi TaxID=2015173 RepID=A0A3L8E3G5_OOCBI|nr:UPF0565 protein C2orf69 homolog isoform X1 [Ooceraea biroi]XP_011345536.2 UPF0565 protein C2orf69 homolog isoform X1 [Ooceraea biroi]RLU26935.1 hypothetical protein DMN91_000734 [Ooceraea biroi]